MTHIPSNKWRLLVVNFRRSENRIHRYYWLVQKSAKIIKNADKIKKDLISCTPQ